MVSDNLPKSIVIPRWSRASGGMRGTHEHPMAQVFMGGPNKSGHDGEEGGGRPVEVGPRCCFKTRTASS
jgi:hypothetical protein